MMLRFAFVMPLFGGLLFVDAFRSPWTIGAYLLLFARLLPSFILGMHVSYHRPWFRSKALNRAMPAFVGFFFGQTIGSYWAHHLAMHHPEDNAGEDLSSTRPFQRDNGWHLLIYMATFLVLGMPQLLVYFIKKGRTEIARRLFLQTAASWAIIGVLAYFDWAATLAVFVVPIVVARSGMMAGNWGQHAFCKEQGETTNTIGTTLLDTKHNRECFNNGYHALHHARQAMHWAELPAKYEELRPTYAAEEAMVFRGVGTFQAITFALILGRYEWLEQRLERFEGDERTPEERIAWMRDKVRPFPRVPVTEPAETSVSLAA